MGWPAVLIWAVLLCLGGITLLRFGLTASRRTGLLSSAFWRTFPEYPGYRLKRVWPLVPSLAGLILLICGAVFLFDWILAYYAARLGHPLS
jgi:hypothetical protein